MSGIARVVNWWSRFAAMLGGERTRKIAVLAGLLLVVCLGQGLAQTPEALPTHKTRILLVTGIDYPGHLWKQTTPVLRAALEKDGRMEVFVAEDPGFLDSSAIDR